MADQASVSDFPIVDPDRVRQVVQGLLRAAQQKGWSDALLKEASGLSPRTIKSYRIDGKQPSLANALALALVLGKPAVNTLLAIIGYGGASPLDEPEAIKPHQIVAELLPHVSTIAMAAADGLIDHTEMPDCRVAADNIIRIALPLSSAGSEQ